MYRRLLKPSTTDWTETVDCGYFDEGGRDESKCFYHWKHNSRNLDKLLGDIWEDIYFWRPMKRSLLENNEAIKVPVSQKVIKNMRNQRDTCRYTLSIFVGLITCMTKHFSIYGFHIVVIFLCVYSPFTLDSLTLWGDTTSINNTRREDGSKGLGNHTVIDASCRDIFPWADKIVI